MAEGKTEEELRQEEKSAISDAEKALELKVNDSMQKVFGDSTETEESEEETGEESTPEHDKESDEKSDEKSAEADESGESDEDSTSQEKKESEDEEEGDLPDAYVRAAIHQGWKEDEVKDFYQVDPEKAKKTFGNIYNSTNRLSKQFAELGKAAKTRQQQEKQPHEKTATEAAEEQKEKQGFVDIEKLKEQYPEDPLIDQVIAPMNDALAQLSEQRKEKQPERQQPYQEQKANTEAERAIVEFFDSDDLDNYSDIYGKVGANQNWDDLTVNQQKTRWSVLETADQILSGAEIQGKEMAVNEALNLAHMIVTEDNREQAIRNDIKKKVQKRGNSLSLKPGGDSSADTGDKLTGKQHETKVANKMKEIFG